MFYRIYAIICLAAFYAIYFVKSSKLRRKGIVADQLGKGDKDPKVRDTEIAAKMVTYMIVPVEVVSAIFSSGKFLSGFKVTGAVCCAVSLAFLYAAVKTLGDSWRAGIPSGEKPKLVTRGVYRISRNPAFLAFDLMYFGILVMFFNVVLLLFTVAAMIMLHVLILNEEKFLSELYGETYERYKEKTGRYFSA